MRNLLLLLLLCCSSVLYAQNIVASGALCPGGGTVTFTANQVPANATLQWLKDGAPIPGATAATYDATAAGSYTVVVTRNNNSDTLSAQTIAVNPAPAPDFTFTTNQCASTPIQFTNTTPGTGNTYRWIFGDPTTGNNDTSVLVNPSHRFRGGVEGTGTRTFNVTMIATSAAGCQASVSKQVTVNQIPDARLGSDVFPLLYDGKTYFTRCAGTGAATFPFTNQSTTQTTNTGYEIKWGNGAADFTGNAFTGTINQTYPEGSSEIKLKITGSNNCVAEESIFVFVGSNPAVGLGNPGNTSICTGNSLTFPISGTSSNSAGTTYTVAFNDGSPPVTFTHPAPADITHTFLTNSCGVLSFSSGAAYANSFAATIIASNPCQTSSASVVPIYVSQSPTPVIAAVGDSVCTSQDVSFTNATSVNDFINGGQCIPSAAVWTISPATGWTLRSGTLGSENGKTNPAEWTLGTAGITLNFSVPGTYTIKLKMGNTRCGATEVTRTVCVNPPPVASFALDKTEGCGPVDIVTTNTTPAPNCGEYRYRWTVEHADASGCATGTAVYNYTGGTSSWSEAPAFRFETPGTYTIGLTVIAPGRTCTSAVFTQTVVVKDKPKVAVAAIADICQNNSISPTATVNNCYGTTAPTYAWSFGGGTPATSTLPIPGQVLYNGAGPQTLTLSVSNECGATAISPIAFNVTPAPSMTNPGNQVVCAGSTVPPLGFSSAVPGVSYTWTNDNPAIGLGPSGQGGLPTFVAVAGATPQVATITVTPATGCTGAPVSFTITVNPTPAAPAAPTPVVFCENAAGVALSATPTGSNTLTWYDNAGLLNGSASAPLPPTTTPGDRAYYVTQTDGTCTSPAAVVVVTTVPGIGRNTLAGDRTICAGTPAGPITAPLPPTGGTGSYTYQWQQSADGISWTDIAGAIGPSYDPGSPGTTTLYRRMVNSGVCTGVPSNTITITVQAALAGFDLNAVPQVICAGTAPQVLDGQPAQSSGAISYQWEQSTDGTTWTNIAGATSEDYQPGVLNSTTVFRRLVSSGTCSATSSVVTITVNPVPVMTPVNDIIVCNNSNFGGLAFGATPAGNLTYNWTAGSNTLGLQTTGSGSLPSFTVANTGNVPAIAEISVIPTLTANGVGCNGAPYNFRFVVLPTVSAQPMPDAAVCSGATVAASTPQHNAGAFPGGSVSYRWTVSGSGISLVSGSGLFLPEFTAANAGTTNLAATITVVPVYSYAGVSCEGNPTSYTITTRPSTPVASAGPDATLCAAPTYTLQGSATGFGTGVWTQVSGIAATLNNPTDPAATLTNLQPGNTYIFLWTVTGSPDCAPTTDQVTITVTQPLQNTVATNPLVVCDGQTIGVTGQPATGGGGTYAYQWQFSPDGNSWSDISGQTGVGLVYLPLQSGFVRRTVLAPPCSDAGQPITVTVQAAVGNNTIGGTQVICVGNTATLLQGSQPTGADGNFRYQWQQSNDAGVTWTDIALATSRDYQPQGPAQTTRYRRLVTTTLCTGPQSSTSNVVTVTVNPDAAAAFTAARNRDCAPFVINGSVIALQADATRNSSYDWFVNGNFVGSGTIFPGHTLTQPNDSVLIKLRANSLFGCKNDSAEQRFYTFAAPAPAFTTSTTGGCGPLDVVINNTTPDLANYRYYWTFGDGSASTQAQPGTVRLAPNPNFGDTVYTITLHAISSCDTFRVSRQVQVGSRPAARFLPDRTVGCSPMRVSFNNTSLGVGNSYSWEFGDGTVVNSATPDSVGHTFITGVRDTFRVKLIARNACGVDSASFPIAVTPNNIQLDFAVPGSEQSGCAPHTVRLVNNTRGATTFRYDFGDGNFLATTRTNDTITHTYQRPGTYAVRLIAANSCTDTSATEAVTVYPIPKAAFTASAYQVCIGDSVRFTNSSDSADAYFWRFGDGTTTTLVNPVHQFSRPGLYTVTLRGLRNNAQGSVCPDSTTQQISVVGSLPGRFRASDTVGICVPFTVTYTNLDVPAAAANWNFGDGATASGDVASHTFTAAGDYTVRLVSRSPAGCVYTSERTVRIQGPTGTFSYGSGYVCNDNEVRFQVAANNTDTIEWDFGDGNKLKTTTNVVRHSYANGGAYLPSARLLNRAGCQLLLPGTDSIRVDKLRAGFTTTRQPFCGGTTLSFRETAQVFYGQASATWNFGDGNTGEGLAPTHTYAATGSYPVQLVVTGLSGCRDTLTTTFAVKVNDVPSAAINALDSACTGLSNSFRATTQAVDSISFVSWRLNNGASATGPLFRYNFAEEGIYTLRLVAGTVNGCYDTVVRTIAVGTTPEVRLSPGQQLCEGTGTRLRAAGATRFVWSPAAGLSCSDCATPLASPTITTTYLVTGITDAGCTDTASVMITVIPKLNLTISANDSICIGQSSQLQAGGALNYRWSPAAGLSSTNVANPLATPTVTTTYRVIGDDGMNCFSDTAFVTVAIGQYPVISLGPDVTLATGTLHPLASTVEHGPIRTWAWSPATDLSCANCPLPSAFIRKDISYTVRGTTAYGCSDTDTISIKVFCESSQVFVPNAFTPDGDGVNDVLMVRGKGIAMVKTFRVFNRWGEVVFEKSSFRPNDPAFGWNGRVRGILGGPEVYLYTAEVVCENGATYTYKGNVSLLK